MGLTALLRKRPARFARPRASAPRVLGAALASVGALAGACAGPGRPVVDPEAAFRARLGQEWALVRLGPREIPPPPPGTAPDVPGRDLVPGRRPTIRFTAAPPGAGGRSFCNGYGSPYELRGDSLRLTRIESSAVGCDGPDSLETHFFRALWGTRRFELDSARLVLIAADGTRLTFVPAGAGSAVR
jgi:heat shock protein HslJ